MSASVCIPNFVPVIAPTVAGAFSNGVSNDALAIATVEVKLGIVALPISPSVETRFLTVNDPSRTSPLIISSITTSLTSNWNPVPNVLGLFWLMVIADSWPSSPPSLVWSILSVAQ